MNTFLIFLLCAASAQTSQPAPSDDSLPTMPASATSLTTPSFQPAPPTPAAELGLATSIRVALRPAEYMLPVGSPVFVEFVVENTTDQPVQLMVPGALVGRERRGAAMGLPLEHVYSGQNFRGLEILSEDHPDLAERPGRKPELPVPPITLAPFGTVGIKFDVARFYPALHQEGMYTLGWRPYGGVLAAEPVTIRIVQYKQVVMETELGAITMSLLYDKAPRHVANFLDLVERRFYNGKVFHNVFQNQFVIGGCPNKNGTGRRPDGVCLPPEFNDTPFDLGTVAMALVEGDETSASCQFFICLARQPSWDGRYTAFARISGPRSLAVLRQLGDVPTDAQHRPLKPLLIKSMNIVDAPYTPKPGK